jgi:hypothetical protein
VAEHLCLTLIIKEMKIRVEHDRVVTTLNIIKHYISYLVYLVGSPSTSWSLLDSPSNSSDRLKDLVTEPETNDERYMQQKARKLGTQM